MISSIAGWWANQSSEGSCKDQGDHSTRDWCERSAFSFHLSNISFLQLPEGSNQLRQMQLRELAMLNGTLREDGIVSTFIHIFVAEISWTDPSESCKNISFPNVSRRKCINWNIFWCKYLLAAAMHELRRNGPPVVAVPGQAKRHQQHSVHKVGFKLF